MSANAPTIDSPAKDEAAGNDYQNMIMKTQLEGRGPKNLKRQEQTIEYVEWKAGGRNGPGTRTRAREMLKCSRKRPLVNPIVGSRYNQKTEKRKQARPKRRKTLRNG